MSEDHKEKIGKANFGKRRTPEQKEKMSSIRKGLLAEGKLLVWNKGRHGIYSSETRRKISDAAKREWQSFSSEEKAYMSKLRSTTFKRMWADKEFSVRMHSVLINNNKTNWRNRNFIEKQRDAHRALWKNMIYVNNVKNGMRIKPNEPELYLDAILQLNFKNEWSYVGDFQFWIDGKNPDFIHSSKPLLIEYNGHPFNHTPERDKAKTAHYAKRGWKTLNLNAKDLKDEKALIAMICNFMSEDIQVLYTPISAGIK